MSSPIKVVPNSFVQLFIVDCTSMFRYSQLHFPFSFANILNITFLARNAINNIVGFTGSCNIYSGRCFGCKWLDNLPFLNIWTIRAIKTPFHAFNLSQWFSVGLFWNFWMDQLVSDGRRSLICNNRRFLEILLWGLGQW